jgi:hypothetical protein
MDSASPPSNVVDLATHRARRNAAEAAEAAGIDLHAQLYVEAADAVIALVAGGHW